jgi:hypothetical protein
MKKGALVLMAGVLLGTAGFSAFYYFGTASSRAILREPQPELGWLKREYKLSDAEFARVTQLHLAYLPQCTARCQQIGALNQRLRELLSRATDLTPEIQSLLADRASMQAKCEAEMLKHFLEVSRTMPAEQGRRYLAWIQDQTFLRGQGMEAHHHAQTAAAPSSEHHMQHANP